jgi:hypothetical protein
MYKDFIKIKVILILEFNTTNMKKIIIGLILASIIIPVCVNAQVSTKVTQDKFEEYRDSLENSPRIYLFPIWGEKVQKMGYDLPLPGGFMFAFLKQEQDLTLENLSISLTDPDNLTDISELVEFSTLRNNTNVYTIRPELWLFPFMNIYVIANKTTTTTDITVSEPIELVVPQVETDGDTWGFGTSLAYGFGPVWASGNFNWAWTTTNKTIEPVQSFSTSLRVGGHLISKNRKHTIAVWVGASYLDYIGDNGGTYDMTELIPEDAAPLQDLQDQLQGLIDGLNQEYEDFCSSPMNTVTCAVLDPIIQEFKDRVDDKVSGLEPPDLTINYRFGSSPTKNWNFVTGARYELNKRWGLHAELGIGGRQTLMLAGTWRFGLLEKKR